MMNILIGYAQSAKGVEMFQKGLFISLKLICLGIFAFIVPLSAFATVLDALPVNSGELARSGGSFSGTPYNINSTEYLIGRSANQGAPNSSLQGAVAVYNFDISSIPDGATISSAEFTLDISDPTSAGYGSCFGFTPCQTMYGIDLYGVYNDSTSLASRGYQVYDQSEFTSGLPSEVTWVSQDDLIWLISNARETYNVDYVQIMASFYDLTSWTSPYTGGLVVSNARLLVDYTLSESSHAVSSPIPLVLMGFGLASIGYTRKRKA